jgi:hypothetical protein
MVIIAVYAERIIIGKSAAIRGDPKIRSRFKFVGNIEFDDDIEFNNDFNFWTSLIKNCLAGSDPLISYRGRQLVLRYSTLIPTENV